METKSIETVFFEACESRDITTAKRLLRDVDPSSLKQRRPSEDRTCLHVAVLAGDPDLLRMLGEKLVAAKLEDLIKMTDNQGDTALHLAVYSQDLVKQLLGLAANLELKADLCDTENNDGETPLKLAITLGFVETAKELISYTSNALHLVVELNQVKLVFLLTRTKLEFLKGSINQPYEPKEKARTDVHCGKRNGDTNTQPIVRKGDTPLHIAARNKYEHMVNLLLKIDGINKHALNNEVKTPLDIAREVVEYHESLRIIRKLGDFERKGKPFMYCAPKVSHGKHDNAKNMVNQAYKDRRNAELVVAALLATMTFTAAFTVPGGFQTDSMMRNELGSPILIRFTSFKLFLIFDCVAFFQSLFVCIMWQMTSELTEGDKMMFMTINSAVLCWSFGFTACGFMAALYTVLVHKVFTFSWVVLGNLLFISLCGIIAFIYQSIRFAVSRARFHRMCGAPHLLDDIVELVWNTFECCGLLGILRSCDDCISDIFFCQFNTWTLGGSVHDRRYTSCCSSSPRLTDPTNVKESV